MSKTKTVIQCCKGSYVIHLKVFFLSDTCQPLWWHNIKGDSSTNAHRFCLLILCNFFSTQAVNVANSSNMEHRLPLGFLPPATTSVLIPTTSVTTTSQVLVSQRGEILSFTCSIQSLAQC